MSFITVDTEAERKLRHSEDYSPKRKVSRFRPRSLTLLTGAMGVIEAAIILVSGVVSNYVYFSFFPWITSGMIGSHQTTVEHGNLGFVLVVICALVFGQTGLYSPSTLFQSRIKVGRVLLALAVSFLVMLALLFLLKVSEEVSRGWIIVWLLTSAFGMVFEREMMWHWITHLQRNGAFRPKVAVYGEDSDYQGLREVLESDPVNSTIIGFFSRQCHPNDREVCGGLEELISLGQDNKYDQIMITLPLSATAAIEDVVERLSVLPVDLILLPKRAALPTNILDCRMIGRLPGLMVRQRPLSDLQWLTKSAFDTVVGAVGLVVLAPIFIAVGIAIKLDSPGPVFFSQRRHGYNHKIIKVLKFRTMNVLEDDGKIRQARECDERVTRVGRLLRRTSLDELPQLWNVLKGEMSIVGPRPHALSHNDYFADLWQSYPRRHRVKPGLTGWAQVHGLRGATPSHEQMQKRAELDLYYIENWSLGLDIEIMLLTLPAVFSAKNAY